MATLAQALIKYSTIGRPWLELAADDVTAADSELLAAVDGLLRAAGDALTRRQPGDAISSYRQAESLIYAHLDPAWRPEAVGRPWFPLPRDPGLFDALLSSTAQWLDVLPVSGPVSPVRPAAPPAAAALGTAASFANVGLHAAALAAPGGAPAAADANLASIFARQGNQAASAALLKRAQGLNAAVAAAPAPAAAPASSVRLQSATARKVISLHQTPLPPALAAQRATSILVGPAASPSLATFAWTADQGIDTAAVKKAVYQPRTAAATLPDRLMMPVTLADRALALPHDYYYTIPLGLAESYHAMGDWSNAEQCYIQAVSYTYLNLAIEGSYVWQRLGQLYLDWGDSFYRRDDPQSALPVYQKILGTDGSVPANQLWTLPGFATAAATAKGLLPQLATLAAAPSAAAPVPAGPLADNAPLAAVLLAARKRLVQIQAGLDFWGHWQAQVPIWTFDYLQQVAANFAQLAQSAEQSVISFWDHADQASLTQNELKNQLSQANAEVGAAAAQLEAAQQEANAYGVAMQLAKQRAADAATDASEYQSQNSHAILLSAEASQVGGGDDGDWQGLSNLADGMMGASTFSGSPATLSAALQLAANRVSQQFQVDQMQRNASEMQTAAAQATAEFTAANARVIAANAAVGVANLQATGAKQALAVFDDATFSPGAWRMMGDAMERISQRYLDMALRTARLMQKAYNFENDRDLAVIKPSYPGIAGLLGADQLLADIQSFTDDMLGSVRSKPQPLKTTISLAGRYGYAFETQLRKTGSMKFETSLDDFDSAYPGSYGGRISRVTVALQGIVPPTGVSGRLTNGGVSVYRLPSDAPAGANGAAGPASKVRIQSAETLLLTDYDPAVDGPQDASDGHMRGIFQGAGVASSWQLDLPREVNDIDFGALTDVVLTFTYQARFDPALAAAVTKGLASRPGYTARQQALPLRWLYPDLFFAFAAGGSTTLSLSRADFPANQTAPVVTAVSLLAAMKPGTSPQGLTVSLAPPGKTAAAAAADAGGVITSQSQGSPWAGLTGGSALGDWVLTASAAANPEFTTQGALDLSALINLVLVLDYSFTPRS